MKTTLRSLCKLYNGEKDNPYKNITPTDNESAFMYLKFHIWDAERAVTEHFEWWEDLLQQKKSDLPQGEDLAQMVYNLAISSKLKKMSSEEYDFRKLYAEL